MSFFATQAEAWNDVWTRFHSNGPGSTIEATAPARKWLQRIITDYGITSMLDAPCGNFQWMQLVNLGGVAYQGWDVHPEQIAMNQQRWPHLTFERKNLLTIKTKSLPDVDLMWIRDLTIHLPVDYVAKLLDKIKASNIRYLAVTNHPNADNYVELPDEGHDDRPGYFCRGLDLEAPPFNLTGRVDSVNEGHTVHTEQEMALYRL